MMKSNIQQPSAASSSAGQRAATVSREAELSAQFSKAAISDLPPLENRASQGVSPYVRAHASTPVAWQLLDDEAIQRAQKENKLIFMNIGFKSCHCELHTARPNPPGSITNPRLTPPDCRLTTQESFSHPEISKLLNTSFIPIIVDREERPDIDNIYMNYVQAINGAGGWPLNVFLTPDLEPVFGGTYWPSPGTELIGPDGEEIPEDERIDFLVILQKMKEVWPQHESRCRQEAKEIVSKLREFAAEGTFGTHGFGATSNVGTSSAAAPTDVSGTPMAGDSDLDLDQLEEAYTHIAGTFDPVNGGFGIAPKFPTPAKLSFLFRLGLLPPAVTHVVGEKEVMDAKHMVYHTLRRLQQSGLRDHLGGGFHRYAVTANWSMPHFEKMVSDNALLLGVYLDAWLSNAKLSKEAEFGNMVFELADYLTSPPILRGDGGFVTSEAADSIYKKGDKQMREGAYYLWTRREFDDVFKGSPAIGALAAAHWNVLEHGNVEREQDPNDEFMNQNVLHSVKDAEALRQQFGTSSSEAQEWIETARATLRAHRDKERVRPATDDKAVTSVNALVISTLARTSAAIKQVDPEKSRKYLDTATKAATFIKEKLWDSQNKVLYRSYSDKRSSTQGFADDYAFLIEALIDLYETAGEERWLEWADELQSKTIAVARIPT